ncbi:OmpA family protein [Photobacterium leiognathi]|uniref:OmpA family protein n=1 Tax=Photobacterium leiognathi TaxID=553611 RepID=UPI0027385B0A|nr:OmpA family protein [Photobacterium leiognathi]
MKTTKLTLLTVALLSTQAMASDLNYSNDVSDTGLYVSASAGGSLVKQNNNSAVGKIEVGYDLTNRFGLFTAYHHSRFTDLGTVGAEIYFPFNDKFGSIYQVGVSHGEHKFTGFASANLTYQYNDHVAFYTGFDYFQNVNTSANPLDMKNFNIGVKYNFGARKPDTDEIIELQPVELTVITNCNVKPQYTTHRNEYRLSFDTGVSTLNDQQRQQLDKIASDTATSKYIDVYGRADKTGNAKINRSVSQKRTDAVSNYLQKHGVSADKISSYSFSNLQPINKDSERNSPLERSVTIYDYQQVAM